MSIRRLLVANRGEIAIRVFRTAHELGIRTVAVYSHEDRYALHRFKADEAYRVGRPGEPIRAYLDIAGIIDLARQHEVDAIHPGYGFLSENPDLAAACEEAGLVFIGPPRSLLEQLGDKVVARRIAAAAGVPVLPGSESPLGPLDDAIRQAGALGYPVLLKAAKGGGGRGMRVVARPEDLGAELDQARRESLAAFGSDEIFLEKFIARPRHVEVQILGDRHGNLVHLYERDCSIQRRHQKVVEIAPALNLDPCMRDQICEAALAIGRAVGYENAGTVEFLLDPEQGGFYFIEVNPRIQVEHTVTEAVVGVDLVKCQILVAQGLCLSDPQIGLPSQAAVALRGHAIQCRVTTEAADNQFMPDYGRITHYRSAGGTGVRLDGGTAFSGAVVTPYYDSLLVKVTVWANQFADAAHRMERCLQEFRIRGVKTNIPFLLNLVTHPTFCAGECTTRFIDETPELFQFAPRRDRATKLFNYLADVIVNGHALVKNVPPAIRREPAPVPQFDHAQAPAEGSRDTLKRLGPQRFAAWILDQQRLLLTDTTFRDAHQSLLATRLRTHDMLAIAEAYARLVPELFSLEMWGGATFDTALRFLKECPWERLAALREKIPNILFQMLLRASNAVGYATYPDNVVRAFVAEAAQAGMDLFRIFDSLNWLPNMRVAMEATLESGALCEAAICYTGDILDPRRDKYSLKYFVALAKELEAMGAHLLAIKDMAGLCKPYAAKRLVTALKDELSIPVHFHTHDTAGVQAGAILLASEVGLDLADAASGPFSGMTSQPNLDSIVEALRFTPRETGLNPAALQEIAEYWEAVREFYAPFEAHTLASTAEVYRHEMPGGQSTNLLEQAKALGLGSRWHDICRAYADANCWLGDIVKVTPSSKAVGDLALFLVTNNLTTRELEATDRELAFPESVVDLVAGRMGQPPGGFPEMVKQRVLRGQKAVECRPGESLPPVDLQAAALEVAEKTGWTPLPRDVLSYLLYPRVFLDFAAHVDRFDHTSVLPTPCFFYGLTAGEEVSIELEPGKTLIVKFLTVGDPHADGTRTVFFELNGQPRSVTIQDRSLEASAAPARQADPNDPKQVAAPMPGLVVTVAVHSGDQVGKGQKLLSMEAMKMETTLYAEHDGRIAEVLVQPGSQVATGDLLVVFD